MPWKPADASSFTRLADTPKRKRMWCDVANQRLAAGDDDASAIRQANAVVHRHHKKEAKGAAEYLIGILKPHVLSD
jgi:hypothetical protein